MDKVIQNFLHTNNSLEKNLCFRDWPFKTLKRWKHLALISEFLFQMQVSVKQITENTINKIIIVLSSSEFRLTVFINYFSPLEICSCGLVAQLYWRMKYNKSESGFYSQLLWKLPVQPKQRTTFPSLLYTSMKCRTERKTRTNSKLTGTVVTIPHSDGHLHLCRWILLWTAPVEHSSADANPDKYLRYRHLCREQLKFGDRSHKVPVTYCSHADWGSPRRKVII